MIEVPYLEIPITHACCLRCDGCSAYSNYGLSGEVSVRQLECWCGMWGERIRPTFVRVLGGEPFLHNNLMGMLNVINCYWPDAHIQVVTNGLALGRYQNENYNIKQMLKDLRIGVWLSRHSNDEKYLDKIAGVFEVLGEWKEFGVEVETGDNVANWNRFYKGVGSNMLPYADGDYRKSWDVCHSRGCLNLMEGRLWKCPQLAGLHLIAGRFGLDKKEEWAHYLKYEGLGVEASNKDLKIFLDRTFESYCGMCPQVIENYEKDIYNTNYELDVERVEAR